MARYYRECIAFALKINILLVCLCQRHHISPANCCERARTTARRCPVLCEWATNLCAARINWENMRFDGLSPNVGRTKSLRSQLTLVHTWLVCYDNCSPVIIVFSMKILVAIDIFIYHRPTQFGVGTHRPKHGRRRSNDTHRQLDGRAVSLPANLVVASSSTAPEPESAHAPHFYLVSIIFICVTHLFRRQHIPHH